MLKCQFHTHAEGDLLDNISHTPEELINKAAELNYDVLSITCHDIVLFNESLKKYAEKKGILLIPGIEFSINKKHILALNIDEDIKEVDTFDKLRNYKKTHPNCLIVAPHAFYPGRISLKKALIENIDVFDAIEYSFCYTKTKNYNKKAVEVAEKYGIPIITSSDCHILKNLDLAYTHIDAPKETTAIIQAIINNKLQRTHRPLSYLKIGKTISQQILRNIFK